VHFHFRLLENMLTGLYTMQDTVDDSEGMSSSPESEDDEENDSLVRIMADRNLWSTQTQVSFFVSEI
jgi:transcription initiation factor TFIID subunit TAF12